MKRTITEVIILHHSMSGDVSANVIDDWHKQNGWSGIGYHYVIRYNGNIEKGRLLERIGAHAKGRNDNSIGICIVGDFSKNKPTSEQLESLEILINGLKAKYEDIRVVEPHHNFCPGRKWNVEKWIEDLK